MIRRLQPLSTLAVTAILILASGCADRTPTEAELRPALKVGDVAQVISAPTSFREGTYGRMIGPEGGSLSFGIGRLDFPTGALSQYTYISATVDGQAIGAILSPHGLVFPPNALPRLVFYDPYAATRVYPAQIAYVDGSLTILEAIETEYNTATGVAVGRLRHFSPYILAQN